jgi:hypothetical protein
VELLARIERGQTLTVISERLLAIDGVRSVDLTR